VHFIDHQILSHDAYLKFIEDDFLGGQRIDPASDDRPDRRSDVREEIPLLGDLRRDFDFNQPPAPPFILPAHPAPWSLPTAFRLLLGAMPTREDPRLHQGMLVAGVTCTTRCHLTVTGYLTIRRPDGRHVRVLARQLTFSGTRRFRFGLARPARGAHALLGLTGLRGGDGETRPHDPVGGKRLSEHPAVRVRLLGS
jgi:hypothetical protein